MNFNKKDVVIGLVIIVVLVASFFVYKKFKNNPKSLETPIPVSVEYKKSFEDTFKIDIPDNENAIELKDVNGGNSRGIATEREILIDADDPESGYFYQAWLENDGNLKSLGKLKMAKGGWLIEFNETVTKGNTNIIVSLEKNFDNTLEKKILVGSF